MMAELYLPWAMASSNQRLAHTEIHDHQGRIVLSFYGPDKDEDNEVAYAIIDRVNAHDELVAALEMAEHVIGTIDFDAEHSARETDRGYDNYAETAYAAITAALAHAKEAQPS